MKKRILRFSPHVCTFTSCIEKEYREAYTDKWIIYGVYTCECGRMATSKISGTINIEDVPEWALNSNLAN